MRKSGWSGFRRLFFPWLRSRQHRIAMISDFSGILDIVNDNFGSRDLIPFS
jgi:hypothetical protein